MSQMHNNVFTALANTEDKVSSETTKVSSETTKVSSETTNSVSRPKGNPWGNVRNSTVVNTSVKSDSGEIKTTQPNVDDDVSNIVASLTKGGWTSVTSKKKVTGGNTSTNNASKPDKPQGKKQHFDKNQHQGQRQYQGQRQGQHQGQGNRQPRQSSEKGDSSLGRNRSTKNENKQSSEKSSGSNKSVSSVVSASTPVEVSTPVSISKSSEVKVSYASMASKVVAQQFVEQEQVVNNTTPEVSFVTKKISSAPKQSYASMAIKPAVEVSQQQGQKDFRKPQVQTQAQQTEFQRSFKTKVFNRQPTGPKPTGPVEKKELPEHYIPRTEDQHSIQFSNTPFIKRVAGAEKSSSTANVLYRLLVQYSIEFYSQPQLMMSTTFFREKLTTDSEDREKVFLLILSQVIALIVHRLIRSDSEKIIEMIFENLPLFDVVPENTFKKISQTDANASENSGYLVYERIRNKWFADMRIIKGFGKSSEQITQEDVTNATERINAIKQTMLKTVYQSEWNGNNLFHSAMYYGSDKTLNMLFKIGNEYKLHNEMHRMLCVKNGINESYSQLLAVGLEAASKDKAMFGFRKKSFDECKRLYTTCVEYMREHFASLVDNEANSILKASGIDIEGTEQSSIPDFTEVFTSGDDDVVVTSENNVFDTTNVIEMLQTGNMEGMIDYIVNHHKLGNIQTIRSTVSIWENVSKTDSTCQEYLTDVLEFADIQDTIREIFPEKFAEESASSSC
jgi:hypothetical protein